MKANKWTSHKIIYFQVFSLQRRAVHHLNSSLYANKRSDGVKERVRERFIHILSYRLPILLRQKYVSPESRAFTQKINKIILSLQRWP